MGLALEDLCHCDAEREDMLGRIVASDESLVHHFNPNQNAHACIGSIL
jgi:hypothetical protein